MSTLNPAELALAERMRLAQLAADIGLALTRNLPLREVLGHCARAVVSHLDAAFARVWTLNEAENVLELQASEGVYTHLNGPHSRVPVGKFKIGMIAEERRPHLTNSVVGDPRVGDQEWAKREGMVSFAGFPLIVGDRLVGVLAMFAREPLSDATLQAMDSVAHGIAIGIDRTRSEDALKTSRDGLTRILESITDGFASLDGAWRYRYVNQEGARIVGRTAGDLLGRDIWEVFPESLGTPFERTLRTAMARQTALEVEQYYPPLGSWFSVRAFPAQDGLSVYYRDVTNRKEAEKRLVVQYAVSRALNSATTLHETAHQLLQAIGRSLGWRLGLLWAPARGGAALQCVQTWAADNSFASDFLAKSRSLKFGPGEGLPGEVWREGQAKWVGDFAASFQYPRSGAARDEGLHAAFSFPMQAAGQTLGVLEFFDDEIRKPDDDLLRTVTTIGDQIGQYLERHRAHEAVREGDVRKSAILETALDAIITMDEDSRIVEFNSAAEHTFGYRRQDVIGKRLPELIIPERFREAHYRGMERYLATGEGPVLGRRIEVAALRADGVEIPIELAITRIPIEGPAVFTAYLRDISERRRAEGERETLLAQTDAAQRYYRVLTEAMPQHVWTATPEGALDYVNERVTQYSGLPAPALLENGWQALVHPDDLAACKDRWMHSLATAELYEVEFRLRNAQGGYRWHLGRALPVFDSKSSLVKWLGTNTDIHDRKQAEDDLRSAKESAEIANRAKSQFLASMSHELRTPLNAIIGYSEMLQEEVEDLNLPTVGSDLHKIHGAGKHLLSLINDVLDLSKIEAGKMELFVETFDIASVLQDVVNTIRPLADKNSNQIRLRYDPSVGAMRADLTKVRQSLFNLLSNASKFTEKGLISCDVSRHASPSGDSIHFRIADTGIGIPGDRISSLFDPFSQVDRSTSRKYGGTGLGLSITQRFCQLMGGDIAVESQPGTGSTFTIRLPAGMEESGRTSPGTETGKRGRNTILVIEDDPAGQDLLCRVLQKEGFQTVSASSGPQALRMVRDVMPMAITLDVMMPGMDGWAVLSALKADPQTADIPVIILSIVDDKNLGYSLGAAEYLTKPIERDRLSAVLGKFRCVRGGCPVLIVEDDAAARQTLCSVLEKHGWKVSEASNGAAALELMEKGLPELILLDLVMPEMDGFEFIDRLRQREAWRSIPVIVITAKDLEPGERVRLNGRVEKVLRKQGYSYEDLLNELNRVTKNSEMSGRG